MHSTSPTRSHLVDSDSDGEFDLFGDEADDAFSAGVKRSLEQRAELARRDKLAQLPPPSQRTCSQNRTAYVLSGQRLQPTKLPHVLTVEECEQVIAAVVHHVHRRGGLQTDRHEKFATTDVPVHQLSLASGDASKTLGDAVLEWVSDRVLGPMASATGFRPRDLGLKDLFVVCYSGERPLARPDVTRYPIPSKQASLAIHSDGCLLSFSLLLNHHDAFDGGGTYFKGSDKTFHVQQGGLLMHDAGLEHAGDKVKSGQRIMLVGFVETVDVLGQKLLWEKQSSQKRRAIQRHAS